MEKVYSKVDPNLLLMVINRFSDISDKRTDLSPPEQFLQCATKTLTKGTTFKPHLHLELQRETNITQEAWVFLTGKVKASFYDIDEKLILETELSAGDCAIVFRAGHSFEVLEDDTTLYEIKNGPYYGVEKDKRWIEPK